MVIIKERITKALIIQDHGDLNMPFDLDTNAFPARTPQQASPLGGVLSDAIAKRLHIAETEKAENEAKYAERNALNKALHEELINKYYGPNIESEIGLRGAQTGLTNEQKKYYGKNIESEMALRGAQGRNLGSEAAIRERELKYPGSSQTGVIGDITRRFLLENELRKQQGLPPITYDDFVNKNQPDKGNQPQAENPNQQTMQKLSNNESTSSNQIMPQAATPTSDNPFRDGLLKHIQNERNPNFIANNPDLLRLKQETSAPQPMAPAITAENAKTPLTARIEQKLQSNKAGFNPLNLMDQYLNAEINYKNNAMGRGGVSMQTQAMLQRQVQMDNTNFTPEQAFEAAGKLVQGETTLDDGTPINASGLTLASASKAALQSTTSALATQQVKANQAEAELEVLNNYAQEGLKPYGNTGLFNMNTDQVMDTFKTDEKSQIQLGRFVASQALQYEAAQNRIKLANGQPGVTSTEELMKMSGQTVNAKYPNLSYVARQEAARFMDEALKKGLEARKKVGISINKANTIPKDVKDSLNTQSKPTHQMSDAELLEEAKQNGWA